MALFVGSCLKDMPQADLIFFLPLASSSSYVYYLGEWSHHLLSYLNWNFESNITLPIVPSIPCLMRFDLKFILLTYPMLSNPIVTD